ncbi:MAG: hypothetical protein CMM78_00795 [Rhodospirillaceae bacterium]|jgi:hypothetical protein|uniref:PAS domain-containing protein n=1 Tax=unclassified Hwanghaeella TaxID=2605944 RepID=UPI000C587517|nr:hypothetical protein [Rhodospirillales bacterium]MAX46719.1 hypothetical protein [Rhodospirillaceae bacterium]|tara:strand:+ start:49006 stop:49539 length:534 start_codon:yes stop_codon:yes gene_type:complete
MIGEQPKGGIYNIDGDHPCEREHLLIDLAYDSSRFKDILSLWTSLRTENALPTKSDFSPHAFNRSALPYLILIDVEHDPLRFRYRLTGTMAESIQNANLTGHYVDDQEPIKLRDLLQTDLEELVRSKTPQHVRLTFTNIAGYPRRLQILRLPLSKNDQESPGEVDHILVVVQFESGE